MFVLPFDGPPKLPEVQQELEQLRDYLDNTLAPHMEKLEIVAQRAREFLGGLRAGEEGKVIERRVTALLMALSNAHRPL